MPTHRHQLPRASLADSPAGPSHERRHLPSLGCRKLLRGRCRNPASRSGNGYRHAYAPLPPVTGEFPWRRRISGCPSVVRDLPLRSESPYSPPCHPCFPPPGRGPEDQPRGRADPPRQREHTQLVTVGDSAQAIHQWRGAKDVMVGFDGPHLPLAQSSRFGQHLDAEANRWPTLASAPLRLTRTEDIPTALGPALRPDVVLRRTNVGAMCQFMQLMSERHRVGLVGGRQDLQSLALTVRELKESRHAHHPKLLPSPHGATFRTTPRTTPAVAACNPSSPLVDTHGPEAILPASPAWHRRTPPR